MIKNNLDRLILHDYLQVNGGAEGLVITLAQGSPGFILGVSGIYPDFLGSGDLKGVVPLVLPCKYGFSSRIARAWLTFKNLILSPSAECIVYSGIYAPLAVRQQRKGKKILYCHTPPRFAFDLKSEYLNKVGRFLRPFLGLVIEKYSAEYLQAIKMMDHVVTNSQHSRLRLLELTGVNSRVIYPPVDLENFRWLGQKDYYLSLGRLEPSKRVELIVKAFLKMPNKKLIVTSGGSEFNRLKIIAANAPNIRFTGWIDNATLANLIGNAIACIYIPRDEDFGISAIESMAAGKPVIGVDEGGLKETVVHEQTGLLLPYNPDVNLLIKAVLLFSSSLSAGMKKNCELQAKNFSKDKFLIEMKKLMYAD